MSGSLRILYLSPHRREMREKKMFSIPDEMFEIIAFVAAIPFAFVCSILIGFGYGWYYAGLFILLVPSGVYLSALLVRKILL